jgi:hypothetical protein
MDSEKELKSSSRFVPTDSEETESDTEKDRQADENHEEVADPDEELVLALQTKSLKKKITVDDAVAWVESQLHDVHLLEEEETIASEYEILKKQMEEMEQEHMKVLEEAANDPDQEERQVTEMMSDAQRTRDTIMKQHYKGTNKIDKLRQEKQHRR